MLFSRFRTDWKLNGLVLCISEVKVKQGTVSVGDLYRVIDINTNGEYKLRNVVTGIEGTVSDRAKACFRTGFIVENAGITDCNTLKESVITEFRVQEFTIFSREAELLKPLQVLLMIISVFTCICSHVTDKASFSLITVTLSITLCLASVYSMHCLRCRRQVVQDELSPFTERISDRLLNAYVVFLEVINFLAVIYLFKDLLGLPFWLI